MSFLRPLSVSKATLLLALAPACSDGEHATSCYPIAAPAISSTSGSAASSGAASPANAALPPKPGRWRFCLDGSSSFGSTYELSVEGDRFVATPIEPGGPTRYTMEGPFAAGERLWKARHTYRRGDDGREEIDGIDVVFSEDGRGFSGFTIGTNHLYLSSYAKGHVEDGTFRCPPDDADD